MGIIPADFDNDANLQSKEVYVSPDRRFIRIHTAPVDNDGEDQHLDGEAYSCKNQIWGCCKCLLCPFWILPYIVCACAGNDICKDENGTVECNQQNMQQIL